MQRYSHGLCLALGSALLLAQCTGGQSGNEGSGLDGPAKPGSHGDAGPGDVSDPGDDYGNCGSFGNCTEQHWIGRCACEDFVGRVALFGVITAFAQGNVEVQVRSVLGGAGCAQAADAGGQCDVAVGEVISATWDGRQACSVSCAEVAAGDQVLALYDSASGRVSLAGWRVDPRSDVLELGDGDVYDEDAQLLVEGGRACVEAVESASGATIRPADAGTDSTESRSDVRADAGPSNCTPQDATFDAGAPPVLNDPTPLDSEHACAQSPVEAPLDCLDVCGALLTCDPQIACDDCLQRCVASPEALKGDRCLSRSIYLIDEEGCARMVQQYEAFSIERSCDAGAPPVVNDACAQSPVEAPLDCLDVCGALLTCDPQIACDDCLQRCVASPEALGGDRCLSRSIIDRRGRLRAHGAAVRSIFDRAFLRRLGTRLAPCRPRAVAIAIETGGHGDMRSRGCWPRTSARRCGSIAAGRSSAIRSRASAQRGTTCRPGPHRDRGRASWRSRVVA